MYELANGQNGKYCRNSTECKEFLNTESGFCNFDHNITGFCESCDDIFESCVGQGFLCERGFRECSSTCEGKDIHFLVKCNQYIFRYSMFCLLISIKFSIMFSTFGYIYMAQGNGARANYCRFSNFNDNAPCYCGTVYMVLQEVDKE